MNLLLAALPGPSVLWRIGAYVLLALSLVGFGWFKGSEHWHGVLIEAQAKALSEGGRITVQRGEATVRVETKYLPQIAQQQVITETIVKEVPIYVPLTDPDLRAGWRELHDAAAAGRVPDPARIADGTAVPAQAAAETVASNYGECRAAIKRLQGLQEWIALQQQVK